MKSFDIDPICIYSDEENRKLCDKYGFESYEFPNDPLGRKLNYGVEMALKSEWDYLMQTNSDDLIKEKLFEIYRPYIESRVQCFGIGEVYFYDLKTGRVAFAENAYPLGCGRMIHRDVFNESSLVEVQFLSSCAGKLTYGKGAKTTMTKKTARDLGKIVKVLTDVEKFKLYSDNKNRVLDFDSDVRLAKIGVSSVKVDGKGEVLVMDIKSETNIWGFDWFEDKLVDIDILKHFPERNEIRKLR